MWQDAVPALINVNLLPLLTCLVFVHQFDRITDHFDLDKPINFRWLFNQTFLAFETEVDVERRVVVDFEDPDFQFVVDENVEAEDLEAAAFGFGKLAIELGSLILQRVGLHRDQ